MADNQTYYQESANDHPKIEKQNKNIPCKNPRLQLPRVPLHLIPMLIRAPKKVRPPMNIQHDPPRLLARLAPLVRVVAHLNPLRAQLALRPPPAPPLLPADLLHAVMAQLLGDGLSALGDVRLGDGDLLDEDPRRAGHPLRGEALDVLDGVVRGVDEEFADEVEAFVVGDVGGGFLREGLAVEVLRSFFISRSSLIEDV